jgi:uncharacterized membrane protein YtjA (UPF0391 family)
MWIWALAFLAVAFLAAIFGFGVASVAFTAAAKLVFYVAVVLFAVSLASLIMRRV